LEQGWVISASLKDGGRVYGIDTQAAQGRKQKGPIDIKTCYGKRTKKKPMDMTTLNGALPGAENAGGIGAPGTHGPVSCCTLDTEERAPKNNSRCEGARSLKLQSKAPVTLAGVLETVNWGWRAPRRDPGSGIRKELKRLNEKILRERSNEEAGSEDETKKGNGAVLTSGDYQ